jgi:hypothetical protein
VVSGQQNTCGLFVAEGNHDIDPPSPNLWLRRASVRRGKRAKEMEYIAQTTRELEE